MSTRVLIGLIGDYDPAVTAHTAIPKALEIAAGVVACSVEHEWIATDTIGHGVAGQLSHFDGLWCVPASPYASMEGALAAIRFAREQHRPFLGTCGGFQHTILEYARHVLGYKDADNAESNAGAAMPLITALSCALVGKNGDIVLRPNSQAAEIYGTDRVGEQYNCSYGFNPEYSHLLDGGHLMVTGVDAAKEPRVVELAGHPFFIATLFQPERSALTGTVHPLIKAYVEAAARTQVNTT